MNELVQQVCRELDYMFGRTASINLLCFLAGEIDHFVGYNGPAIRAYCADRRVI